MIVAASDTIVDVKHADDGGITLVVARGSVDCDVAPRNNRPPFHVIAGDVSVEVVGTRFTVARTPSPRVDVVRGKVRVRAPGGTWLLSAGESWTPPVTGSDVDPVAVVESPVSPMPVGPPASATAPVPAPMVGAVAALDLPERAALRNDRPGAGGQGLPHRRELEGFVGRARALRPRRARREDRCDPGARRL